MNAATDLAHLQNATQPLDSASSRTGPERDPASMAAPLASPLQTALDLLCALTPNVQCGVILASVPAAANGDSTEPSLRVAATWPRRVAAAKELENAAATAWARKQLVILRPGNDRRVVLAQPLSMAANAPTGASAIAFTPPEALTDDELTQLGRRAGQWISLLTQPADPAGLMRAAVVLEVLAKLLSHTSTQGAARALCGDLATRFSCERASLGLLRGKTLHLLCMAPTVAADRKLPLGRAAIGAMYEAMDQQATMLHPAIQSPVKSQRRITVAHDQLVREGAASSVLTVPFGNKGKPKGALTLELAEAQAFDADTVLMMDTLMALAGPVLDMKDRLHGPLPLRARLAWRALFEGAKMRRIVQKRVLISISAVLALLMLAIPVDYRISADARVEGAIERTLAAPVDGFIRRVNALPGDKIKAGEVIATLDDEDAKLEVHRAEGEFSQADNLYNDAVARQDRAQLAINYAKRESAAAQLSLAKTNLTRMRIVAPFDGTLADGDLSRAIGAPVKRGDVLIKIIPGNDHRITLKVDERDVAAIAANAKGGLTLTSRAGETLPIAVARITPVSNAQDGRNTFEIEARLLTPAPDLRPGLEGVARLDAGRHALGWVMVHRTVDWMRLRLWHWFG